VIKSGQVTLDGIRFGGPGAATYADAERAIEAIGAYAAIAIRRCVIDGFRGWGMYLRRVVNPLVEDNEVSHIGYIGIGLLSAVGGTVRRNEVSYVGEDTNVGNERNAYGIVQTSANANEAQCTDVLVDRNTVHHVPHWHAFDCHAAIRPAFTNNVVHHSRKGFFLTGDSYGRSTSALVCTGNTITDPWSPVIGNATAILTAAVKGGKITGNTIKGFGTGTGAIYDFQGQSTALVTTPNTIV
jgi:parallel beta-helix repeat protein